MIHKSTQKSGIVNLVSSCSVRTNTTPSSMATRPRMFVGLGVEYTCSAAELAPPTGCL